MGDPASALPAFFSEAASAYLKLQKQFDAKCAEHNELLAHVRSFQSALLPVSASNAVHGDTRHPAATVDLGTSLQRPNAHNTSGEAIYVDLALLKRTLETQFNELRLKVENKERIELECHAALHENNMLKEKHSAAERLIEELEAKVTVLESGKNDDGLSLARMQEEILQLREQGEQSRAKAEETAATNASLRAQLQATKRLANDALTGENEVSQALLLIDQQAQRLRRELHDLRRKRDAMSSAPVNPLLLPAIKPKVNIGRYLRLQDILPKPLLLNNQRAQFTSSAANPRLQDI